MELLLKTSSTTIPATEAIGRQVSVKPDLVGTGYVPISRPTSPLISDSQGKKLQTGSHLVHMRGVMNIWKQNQAVQLPGAGHHRSLRTIQNTPLTLG